MQPGLLFHRPTHQPMQVTISSLLSSFSAALGHFFPLAGRLRAVAHGASSLCFSLACNDRGAEFVHATALSVTVSDLLAPRLVPAIVHSFFPLGGLVNYDGLDKPLLAAQVTELGDGIFVAVSLNHSVADATTLWHFINTWSGICRSGGTTTGIVNDPPTFERWFPDSCPPPYPVHSRRVQDIVRTAQLPLPFRECFLHFSAESVAKLKSRANTEMGTDDEISSLQSLLAHVWRSVTRARGLKPEEETTYGILAGYRARLGLPKGYFGNSAQGVVARAPAGEVVVGSLGRAAWLLNRAVASLTEAKVRESVDSWWRSFGIPRSIQLGPASLVTGSSPRFDVYGNDFGWGRPVAVRNGRGLKADGIVTVYAGRESGSMEVEVCLSPYAMTAMLGDEEFMEALVHA